MPVELQLGCIVAVTDKGTAISISLKAGSGEDPGCG